MLVYSLDPQNQWYTEGVKNAQSSYEQNKSAGIGSLVGASLGDPMALMDIAGDLMKPAGFDNLIDSFGLGKLFGQNSEEHFAQKGMKFVKEYFAEFQKNMSFDMSAALSKLSENLNFKLAHLQLQLNEAEANRTKNGLPKSVNSLKDGLKKFNEIVLELSKTNTIKTQSFKGSQNVNGNRTVPWSYNKYKLTPKPVVNSGKTKKVMNADGTTSVVLDLESSSFFQSKYFTWILIGLVPFGVVVYGVVKLFKKLKK